MPHNLGIESRAVSKSSPWLWRTLTSIRLTVFLLLIVAGVAVAGTLVPQDQSPDFYLSRYGGWGDFLVRTGVTQVYFSPWFLIPISLLAVNILACVIHGLPRAVRRSLKPLASEAGLSLPERGKFSWPPGVDPRPLIFSALGREVGTPRQEVLPRKEVFLVERGRLRPLGPYLIHLGLLLILAGALIGKFWGVEGQLALDPGEKASAIQLRPDIELPLNFQVRLEQFQVSYYEQGSTPKEFRSDLTFLKDGKEVTRAICRVNEPVSFEGFTFYQSSYGSQPAGPVRLRLHLGGRDQDLEVPLRRMVELPEGKGQVMAVKVDGNFQGYGPAVMLALQAGASHPLVFWVLKDHPDLGEQPGPYRFTAESIPIQFYSVFQVKRDPGVWWVYAGFILFLPGFYLAFFRPAQRWAVVMEQNSRGGFRGRLLGASPRHREEFAACQERLLADLKRGTSS